MSLFPRSTLKYTPKNMKSAEQMPSLTHLTCQNLQNAAPGRLVLEIMTILCYCKTG